MRLFGIMESHITSGGDQSITMQGNSPPPSAQGIRQSCGNPFQNHKSVTVSRGRSAQRGNGQGRWLLQKARKDK